MGPSEQEGSEQPVSGSMLKETVFVSDHCQSATWHLLIQVKGVVIEIREIIQKRGPIKESSIFRFPKLIKPKALLVISPVLLINCKARK